MDLFKSKVDTVMLRTYLEAKKQQEQGRQKSSSDRLAIYHDDWRDILEAYLQTQFVPANYKNVRFSINTSQNLTKKIVNETSLVYKDAPTRSLDVENDLYDEILDYLNLDVFMKKVNKYMNLLNDVIIQVGWDEEKEQLTLNLITPAVASVIQNELDPTKADGIYWEVSLNDSQYNASKYFVYWDRESHYIFDENGNHIAVDDNEDMINPYGILPFVFIHKEQIPGEFWNVNGGNDFIKGTVQIGMKKTFKDYLYKAQSFRQPYMTVDASTKVPTAEMLSDPLSVLILKGDNVNIGVLDLQVAFKALDETIATDANGFLGSYGLNVEAFSGIEASGRALEIKNRQLMEIREDQIEIFRRAESDLYGVMVAVNNYHNVRQLPENAKSRVDYAEVGLGQDPKVKRESADHDLQAGLISPAEYYMLFNPDVKTTEEADEKIRENLASLREVKDVQFSVADTLEDDDEA